MSSRSRAACSKSRLADASLMRRSSRLTNFAVFPAMKSQKSSAMAWCSSGVTRPTQGAEHLSM